MPTSTHPRLVAARRQTAAAAAPASAAADHHDADQPIGWAREDTLFVVLLIAAIMFCSGIGLFAL